MTGIEIKELEDKLKKINIIKACLSAANNNIKTYDKIFGKEIAIYCNDEDSDSKPIYISGEEIQAIKSILLKRQKDIINKYEEELKELK